MTETGDHDPQMTHEIRNTHEAIDDEPRPAPSEHFWPERAVADLVEHALPDLRRARDRIQFVPLNRRLARIVAELEDTMMMLRTERHR